MAQEPLYCNVTPTTTEALRKDNNTGNDSGRSGPVHRSALNGLASGVSTATGSEVKGKHKVFVITFMLLLSVSVVLLVVTLSAALLYTLPLFNRVQQDKENLLAQLQDTQEDNNLLTRQNSNLSLQNSNLILQNSNLSLQNSNLILQNSNLTIENKNLQNQLSGIQIGCPTGWQNFSGSCYHFSSKPQTWHKSRDDCVTMGGHLIIIKSAEEQEFVRHNLEPQQPYWIGLAYSVEEKAWHWVDNRALNHSFG
ncbi:hypothetical protein ACEWY4_001716 [Coilia grayii]|uniref:C-type lectin domain-containing protein n=1 Tax=Coilia grayii TaxID=363190 RepID=A0ABD1KTT4_9TELE